MTGKHHNWHRAWSRLPNGRLRHISGAEFVVERGDGYTDINVAPETLDEYQRGVPVHDLAQRLMRPAREDAARLITQGNAIKAGRPIPGYAKTGK